MLSRHSLFYVLICCVLFSNVYGQTSLEFDQYLHKQDSLIRKAYARMDAETQISLVEDILTKYEELSQLDKEKYKSVYINSFYGLSCAYSLLNNKSKALEYLGKSLNAGFVDYSHIKVDADLDNIRNEKEFKDLILSAQNKYLDSLKTIISKSKQNASTMNSLYQYAVYYNPGNSDSALFYFNKAYELAVKLKNDTFQIQSTKALEQFYAHNGNFQKALELNFEILRCYEKRNDTMGIADTWLELGGVYDNLGDSENSILYNKKAYFDYKKLAIDPWRVMVINSANNIGYKYTVLNMPDSALLYFQESNAIANNEIKNANTGAYAFTLYGLGKVNYQLKNLSIAMPYYKQSLASIDKDFTNNYHNWIRGLNYMGLGELFKAEGHTDSAIVYYKEALKIMPEKILIPIIYKNLAELYKNSDKEIAFDYLMKEGELRDSLYNANNKRDLKNLTLNEQERQKAIVTKQKLEEVEREQNIQYAMIALGLFTFILLFLLLSRSFITNSKWIEFLGVVILLIVFEFVNLVMHPFLERITHHSPALMLLALVCIAALLVPLQHKWEKWATKKLVEKNKVIRLANAKKTIEKLEEKK